MDPFGIISLNCHGGINTPKKLEQIIYYLNNHEWQVALLQETSFLKEKTKERMAAGLESFVIQHPYTPQRSGGGVATLVKNSIKDTITDFSFFAGHRGILLGLSLQEKNFTFCNLYANVQEKDKKADFDSLSLAIADRSNVIVGGDLNGVTALDQRLTTSDKNKIDEHIINFIKKHKLNDLPVLFNIKEITFLGRLNGAILDRFLADPKIEIHSYFTTICPFSDHSSVHISLFNSLQSKSKWRPKSTWKLNTSLLDDPNTIKSLQNLWEEWQLSKPYFQNIGKWWEIGKAKIKKFLIKEGIEKAKERRKEKEDLESQIKLNISNKNTTEVVKLKARLKALEEYKVEGARIRSRQLLLPTEEKGSSDFFAMEGKNRKVERINSLLIDGKESFEERKIKDAIFGFYAELYKSKGSDGSATHELLQNIEPINLTQLQKKLLNDFFSESELKQALWKMKNQKTPGGDGLPKEFYVKTWDFLGGDLAEMINNCYLSGQLPASLREAQIKLLYKKGDKRNLKNWRPVSLLSVDYKILSAALAGRLSGLMQQITSAEQGCSVRGRHIYDNLRLIEDLISRDELLMSDLYSGGIIKALDLEKAFDRVEHSYLRAVLEKLNIGEGLVRWIDLLYNGISSRVMTPFGLTDPIAVTRSVRQGCPLSMALFSISTDPLIRAIKNDPGIEGIKIDHSTSIKIAAYADDTTLFLKGKEDERKALSHISTYEKASGAKCNPEKTKSLLFGRYRADRAENQQDFVEILGIYFHHDPSKRIRKNWERVRGDIKSALAKWKPRNLSILGQVTIINSIAISKTAHLNRILPCPPDVTEDIEKILRGFVSLTRPPGYSDLHMARPTAKGGFGFPLFGLKCLAQHYMWLKAYILSGKHIHPWKILFEQMGGSQAAAFLGENIPPSTIHLAELDYTIFSRLKPHRELQKIDWSEATMREIYNTLAAPCAKKFSIEITHTAADWENVWERWTKIELRNDYKTELHVVLANHFNLKKYRNRSGNCPLCDYDFVQSRDHSFLKCKGAKYLQEQIQSREGVLISEEDLFMCSFELRNAKVFLAYVATISSLSKGREKCWGVPSPKQMMATYDYHRRVL